MTSPAGTRRLFAPGESPDPERHPSPVIAALLEAGDSDDLAWLFRAISRRDIEAWLQTRGGRRLSRRSCRFWEHVLGVRAAPPHPLAPAIWPY